MTPQRFLLRLLLLALCFHTVVGQPAHEAGHIRQRAAWAAAWTGAAGPPSANAFGQAASSASPVSSGFGIDAEADSPAASQAAAEGRGPGGHGGAALDTLCAWCAAFSQVASALVSPPPPLPGAADAAARAFARGDRAFVPRPDRWCFAARDPPLALAGRAAPASS